MCLENVSEATRDVAATLATFASVCIIHEIPPSCSCSCTHMVGRQAAPRSASLSPPLSSSLPLPLQLQPFITSALQIEIQNAQKQKKERVSPLQLQLLLQLHLHLPHIVVVWQRELWASKLYAAHCAGAVELNFNWLTQHSSS